MSLRIRGGVWWFQKRVDGKLYRKSTGIPVAGAPEKKLAERRAQEFYREILEDRFFEDKKQVPTLREWWATYEKTYLPLKGARTQKRDRGTMELHALPYFGGKRLNEITKSDCIGYMNMRRAATAANPGRKTPTPIAEGTVMRERQLLQAVFHRALEDGHLTANPWKGIKREAYKVRERVLHEDEQARLLAQLAPKYQRFTVFCLGTGARLDEVIQIEPARDLDLTKRTVTVFGKGRKWRTIPLTAPVVAAVEQQLAAEKRLWPHNPAHLRDTLVEAAERAGIPRVTPHVLRHTFGWRWIKSGGDIYVLSKILGHASVEVTQKHYAHVLKEDLRAAMDARELGLEVTE